MARRDITNLITIEELLEKLPIKKMSTLRIYVSKYKIFKAITTDPEDRRKLKFDGRCCVVRSELINYCPPGIQLEKVGEYLNAICGENDEILLERFSQRDTTDKIIDDKIEELVKMINNGAKQVSAKV